MVENTGKAIAWLLHEPLITSSIASGTRNIMSAVQSGYVWEWKLYRMIPAKNGFHYRPLFMATFETMIKRRMNNCRKIVFNNSVKVCNLVPE